MAVVQIGRNASDHGAPVIWNTDQLINGHLLVWGQSGSGKTYRLRRIITQLARQKGARIYVFDCHGDLDLAPEITSSVKFSEASSYGINPLVVDPDPDAGGVRRRISTFISMVEHYSRLLGDKQKAALYRLMEEFYRANGYDPDNPATWIRDDDKTPTFLDFKKFTREKIKALYIGGSGTMRKAMDSLCSKLRSLALKGAQKHTGDDEDMQVAMDEEMDEIEELRGNCMSAFREVLNSLESGDEIDQFIDDPEKDVIRSVYKRIENLYASGVFKNSKPSFDRKRPIWRFDVYSLTHESRGFLVEVYLHKIFQAAKIAGLQKEPLTYIILDEAHLFLSPEHDHIILRLVREGRKFGLSLMLASQAHSHFPDEIATGCASKLILSIDDQHKERMGRLLGIKPKRFQNIQPRRSALMQMNTHSTDNNGFIDVTLGAD